jgi:hypothetical protein
MNLTPSSRTTIVATFYPIVDAAEWEFAPSCSGQMDISETLHTLLMTSSPESGIEAYQHP